MSGECTGDNKAAATACNVQCLQPLAELGTTEINNTKLWLLVSTQAGSWLAIESNSVCSQLALTCGARQRIAGVAIGLVHKQPGLCCQVKHLLK